MISWMIFLGLSAVVIAGNTESKLLKDHSAGNRTARSLPCPPNEYPNNGLCCVNCPAGTRVSTHCTVNHGPGNCSPCTPGKDFTARDNGMDTCLNCHPCRFNDQVQVSECTGTRDYRCECKPDTFCTDSCSLFCKDCTRCPEGQRVKHECTPTSDTVCEDIGSVHPTANPTDAQILDGNNQALYVALPVSFVAAIVIIGAIVLIHQRNKQKDKENLGGSKSFQKPVEDSLETVRIVPVMDQEPVDNTGAPGTYTLVGQQDKEDFIEVGNNHLFGVTRPFREEEAPCDVMTGDPTDKHLPNVETCTRMGDPISLKSDQILTEEDWLECYNCLKENVSPGRWKEMIRHLGFPEVDIEYICLNHNDIREANYQMLYLWRSQNGQKASMNKVLHVLEKMDLRGCKENVVNGLRCKGIHTSL